MPTLASQIRERAHVYVAHGGKQNRRQQVERLVLFVTWAQAEFRLNGLEQLGKRHVISYWKAHRDLAPRTAEGYWRAIGLLWVWLDRVEPPPKPWVTDTPQSGALP